MPLKLKGSSSGDVTLDVPAAAGTNTLTLPARTGNIITSADTGTVTQAMLGAGVAGNGPAFSAYRDSSNQAISPSTWTKVQLNAESFDTNNCFDSTTNYRFTPNIAGYYIISASVSDEQSSTTPTRILAALYKNGALYERLFDLQITAFVTASGSACVYLNGSTDYIELYTNIFGSSGLVVTSNIGGIVTKMNGALVRAA